MLKQTEVFQLSDILGNEVTGYENLIEGWRLHALNYDYGQLQREYHSVNLGNEVVLDYGNWDLPPVCFQ